MITIKFPVQMKITGAMDKHTITNQVRIQSAYTSADVNQAGENHQKHQHVQTVPDSSAQFNRNQQQQPVSAPRPVQQKKSAVPAVPSGSTLLKRGQKFTVADKQGNVPSELKFVLNWEVMNPQCDLDASAFLLADNEKVPDESWFVFYGQPSSPDKSICYSGNTGNGAEMEIHLTKIYPAVQKITFAVTIYEAITQRLHFGMVQNVSLRIFDSRTNTELARLELTDCTNGVTALVVGELYRYKGAWKFNAVGSGVARDLAGFCAMYGIEAG